MLAFWGTINIYAYDVEVDGICYNLSENEATVTKGKTYGGRKIIPSNITLNGRTYEVTRIGRAAFQNCDEVTSVSMPNTIKYIEEYAFCGCEGLTDISISKNLISIGDYGLSFCSSLTTVNLPNSLTTIGEETFKYCSGLQTITIPNGVTSIGNGAFYECI